MAGTSCSPWACRLTRPSCPSLRRTWPWRGSAFAPYGSGRHYLNFAERATDPAAFYGEEAYARLRRVKTVVDPGDLCRGNHQITACRMGDRAAVGVMYGALQISEKVPPTRVWPRLARRP